MWGLWLNIIQNLGVTFNRAHEFLILDCAELDLKNLDFDVWKSMIDRIKLVFRVYRYMHYKKKDIFLTEFFVGNKFIPSNLAHFWWKNSSEIQLDISWSRINPSRIQSEIIMSDRIISDHRFVESSVFSTELLPMD